MCINDELGLVGRCALGCDLHEKSARQPPQTDEADRLVAPPPASPTTLWIQSYASATNDGVCTSPTDVIINAATGAAVEAQHHTDSDLATVLVVSAVLTTYSCNGTGYHPPSMVKSQLRNAWCSAVCHTELTNGVAISPRDSGASVLALVV
jgi:hypothetical protein